MVPMSKQNNLIDTSDKYSAYTINILKSKGIQFLSNQRSYQNLTRPLMGDTYTSLIAMKSFELILKSLRNLMLEKQYYLCYYL